MINMKHLLLGSLALMSIQAPINLHAATNRKQAAITSVDTKHTVTKVQAATIHNQSYIAISTYEGRVMLLNQKGDILSENPLSGYMNHDICLADINQDNSPEILAANADGHIYCVDTQGKKLWEFKVNEAPMYSVCVVKKDGTPYIVCGGYDTHMYYLDATGKCVKDIATSTYSNLKPWGKFSAKAMPESGVHMTNQLRSYPVDAQNDVLVEIGTLYSMTGSGQMDLFHPLEDLPFKSIKLKAKGATGHLSLHPSEKGKLPEAILGPSSMVKVCSLHLVDTNTKKATHYPLAKLFNKEFDGFGYRVVQTVKVPLDGQDTYLSKVGARIMLMPMHPTKKNTETLANAYSYNDMSLDKQTMKLIFASAQSGGSAVHIIDLNNKGWKKAYENLAPIGKIAAIRADEKKTRKELKKFRAPKWESISRPVHLMSENKKKAENARLIAQTEAKYKETPLFMETMHTNRRELYDRSEFLSDNSIYLKKRDRRMKYVLTREQAIEQLADVYKPDTHGVSYWAGHGNDPMQYSTSTLLNVLDKAPKGQKTIWIFPELEHYEPDFKEVIDKHFTTLADALQKKNGHLFIRTKHTYWQAIAHIPMWNVMRSGKYADVFIPSMEETTDKSMELSLASRLGFWASGAVNQWGTRCARDNTSFDRMRQFSHQMLPNHFLRTMIYHMSYGATFADNFSVDQDYMSILWEMLGKGLIFVPKREQIVSFSPVHLSMIGVNDEFMDEGNNVKWLTFYNKEKEDARPMVFSRLNGTWPGAPTTAWDFSRYAANVKERRLGFLSSYPNGMVTITPSYDAKAPRGKMVNHLHPLYKDILKEYYTDGRYYYATNDLNSKKLDARTYYKTVQADIQASSKKLPVTVQGDVAWVAAQSAPKHIRLTLIDGGYINPKSSVATVSFHTVQPIQIKDLLTGETFRVDANKQVEIPVGCGSFRFLDVTIEQAL